MRMKKVSQEELAAMDAESDRCALELSDARVDVMGYACLVAIMAMGLGYHRESESRLAQRTLENGVDTPIVTSAGALVEGLKVIGAKRIALVAPYMKPLTEMVVNYIRAEGFEVVDYRALEISDNLDVARHDPMNLPGIVAGMNLEGVDAIVLSACVQMPSLPAVARVEAQTGKPVITAAIATSYQLLKALDLEPVVPGAGALLSGAY
jgi:maleate isomerase